MNWMHLNHYKDQLILSLQAKVAEQDAEIRRQASEIRRLTTSRTLTAAPTTADRNSTKTTPTITTVTTNTNNNEAVAASSTDNSTTTAAPASTGIAPHGNINNPQKRDNTKQKMSASKTYQAKWEAKFEQLKAFQAEHGHCNVPSSYKPNPGLGNWVHSQRAGYRNTINMGNNHNNHNKTPALVLTAERILRLQKLGFEWHVQTKIQEDAWETRFRQLIQFQSQHGHLRVPKRYEPNRKLAHWVCAQRIQYSCLQRGFGDKRRKGLTDERIRRLEELGFEWVIRPYRCLPRQQGAAVAQNNNNNSNDSDSDSDHNNTHNQP